MITDNQLGAWQRQWQTASEDNEGVSVASLRRRVERESRRMKIGLLAPVAVTIGIGGAVLLRALGTGRSPDLVLAIGAWTSIVTAWAVTLWIAHGTWRPFGQTTASYVDLSIRRCRNNVRIAKFGAALYTAQLLFLVLWRIQFSSPGAAGVVLTAWPFVLLGWVGFPLFLVWLMWYLHVRRAELATLLDLREQIDGAR